MGLRTIGLLAVLLATSASSAQTVTTVCSDGEIAQRTAAGQEQTSITPGTHATACTCSATGPTTAPVRTLVTFSATDTGCCCPSASGATKVSYVWTFTDYPSGVTIQPPTASTPITRTFDTKGTYSWTFTVRDFSPQNTILCQRTGTITITDPCDQCVPKVPVTGTTNTDITFAITCPPTQNPLTATWSFGDGTFQGSTGTGVHRYTAPGTYQWTADVSNFCRKTGTIKIVDATATVDVLALEVTQGIQNWRHDAVLIAGKRTFVRAHVKGPAASVTLELSGRSGATPLAGSPLVTQFTIKPAPERSRLTDAALFELPTGWTTGEVQLTLTARNALVSGAPSKTVNFERAPSVAMRLVPLAWTGDDQSRHIASSTDLNAVFYELQNSLPTATLQRVVLSTLDVPFQGQPDTKEEFQQIARAVTDLRARNGHASTTIFYVGVLSDTPRYDATVGIASSIPGFVAATYPQFTVPTHEFGHMAGLAHMKVDPATSACPPVADLFPSNPPYAEAYISPATQGETALYGFAWATPVGLNKYEIIRPEYRDLMTYCTLRWFSDNTYERIKGSLPSTAATTHAQKPTAATGGLLLVSGTVASDRNTATIESISAGGLADSTPANGDLRLHVRNETGAIIAEAGVVLLNPSEGDTAIFSSAIPVTDGAHTLALVNGARELATVATAPQSLHVKILSPQTSEIDPAIITWESDPARPATIELSLDNGITWETIATNLSASEFRFDWQNHGGTTTALLRISVTDGPRIAAAVSPVFTLTRRAPRVTILPPAREIVTRGTSIVLRTEITDAEDGTLPESRVQWLSDKDGLLGIGAELVTGELTVGLHRITVEATDSDGNRGTAVTQLLVAENTTKRRAVRR